MNDRDLASRSDDAPPDWLADVAARTPARIFVDRSGPCYTTATQLQLQADHALAVDAVHDEIDLARDFAPDFVAARQLFTVESLAASKREFLLRPELGRRLSDAARDELAQRCPYQPQIQIVLGDGLSAAAVVRQTPPLLPLLEAELSRGAAGAGGRPSWSAIAG